ncbi:hypothetical protein D3C85_173500 [compost metagenome]
MKHKQFNSVLPYGYFLVRKTDGMKYVGIRYANVKYNLTPNEDFGRVYFTSGRLEKEFKNNPDNFEFSLKYTFDSVQELFEWERKIALRVYKLPHWANQGWGQNYGENPEIGNLISEGKRKVGRDGKTSIERGSETLKDWIWNTEEGFQWRQDISERVSDMRSNWDENKVSEIQEKRKLSMDFKAAAQKTAKIRSEVGEDGLTCYQRSAIKMHETKLENGIYEVQGKTFSDWVWNTNEGEEYRKAASEKGKARWDNFTEEERQEIVSKMKETKASKSEEEKQIIIQKAKDTRSLIGEDGLNDYQRAAIKSEETKKENGSHEKAAKKRTELFNKKLSEMSEEEFEKYCADFIPRLAKSFRTRRNKYLSQIGVE